MKSSLKMRLVLASQSPRRKELLSHLSVPMEIVPADIDENINCSDPALLVQELSRLKAFATWQKLQKEKPELAAKALVLAADTTVALEGLVFGKPADVQDARRILKALSGKTHDVYSAFSLMGLWSADKKPAMITCLDHSRVTFEQIDNECLEIYLDSGESLDKAGAYGIQGQGLMFISRIEGAYSNVVGLPLYSVIKELKKIAGPGQSWRQMLLP